MPSSENLGKGGKMCLPGFWLEQLALVVPSTEIINLGGGIGFRREGGTFSCRHTEFEFSVGHPKVELPSRQSDTQV